MTDGNVLPHRDFCLLDGFLADAAPPTSLIDSDGLILADLNRDGIAGIDARQLPEVAGDADSTEIVYKPISLSGFAVFILLLYQKPGTIQLVKLHKFSC